MPGCHGRSHLRVEGQTHAHVCAQGSALSRRRPDRACSHAPDNVVGPRDVGFAGWTGHPDGRGEIGARLSNAVTEEQVLAIYRETIGPLYAYVSRRCGADRELAEDITQDAWLRAVRSWNRDGLPERPGAWLTIVSRNLLFNHYRRRQTAALDDPAMALVPHMDTGEPEDAAEVAGIVRRALARLPLRQSRLLEAFHYEGRRVADLAAEMGISERAVEGRLRRARRDLRRELEGSLETEGGMQ